MRSLVPALAVCLAATAAFPGGIDQSGQPVTLLFHEGNYAELGLGYVMPRISSQGGAPGTGTDNAYDDIVDFAGGIRWQLGERLAAALIVDKPYGVIVNYDLDDPPGDFAYAGTSAEPHSLGVTGLLRYTLGPRWSLHGGLRATRFGGEAKLRGWGFGPALDGYSWEGDDDWGLGYVAGVAYEVPEIALRVALTYGSKTDVTLDSVETHVFDPGTGTFGTVRSETDITMPQSVNLEFQTGLNPKTLLYGSMRWADWEGWNVAPAGYVALVGAPLVEFEHDTWHYELGIGRQLTERVAGTVKLVHEAATGDIQTVLMPYDGFTGVAVGGSYEAGTGLSFAGGVQLSFLGDADVLTPTGVARFRDNRSVLVGVKVGYEF